MINLNENKFIFSEKMKESLVILVCVLFLAPKVLTVNETDSVESTFAFIERTKAKLELTKDPNIILLIGNPGSGKSTLVHYVAGDYSKLISIEPDGDESDFKIHDGLDPELDEIISTTESRTLVPEMVIDEKGNVWYDCPGFADTRNRTVEIASTIFIKSVIENASNIKIVLVVNYASVTEGYDRLDLDRLMTHATQLIKHIDRYKYSVALVVSKTPPVRIKGSKLIDVHEDSVKRTTAKYMRGYRTVLEQKGSNEEKIQLIEALSQVTSNDVPRKISIFWRPNDAGAFNTIPKMVDGRQKIRKSILEDTSYTEIRLNDFGFPLSDGAQTHIASMVRHTIALISEIIMIIDDHVCSALQRKIGSIDSFLDRFDLLEMCKRSIELNTVKTLEDLSERFATLTKILEINSMDLSTQFYRLEQQKNNLNNMKKITQVETFLPIHEWIANSAKTINYLMPDHKWYSFLVQLYEFFAGYEVQKNITARLSDWRLLNKPQGPRIDANNFNEFISWFPGNTDVTPTPLKLKELNELIEITLFQFPTQYECKEGIVKISGNFVKSSDLHSYLDCLEERWENIRISVFAVNTFFVDSDVDLQIEGGRFVISYHDSTEQLNIFGVKWKILQPTMFNLNGGGPRVSGPPYCICDAGDPGMPGQSAANFFGLSSEIINGDLLMVNLTGRNGAHGQVGTSCLYPNVSADLQEYGESSGISRIDDAVLDSIQRKGYDAKIFGNIRQDTGSRFSLKVRVYPHQCCGVSGGEGGPGKSNNKFSRRMRIQLIIIYVEAT